DASQVHLRERAERAEAADSDLVAALDDAGDPTLDRHAGLRRDRKRLTRLRALPEPMRETNLVARRRDRGLDVVADLDLQLALIIAQLGAIDPRLAFAAHVDEHVLVADLDHAALDHLTKL